MSEIYDWARYPSSESAILGVKSGKKSGKYAEGIGGQMMFDFPEEVERVNSHREVKPRKDNSSDVDITGRRLTGDDLMSFSQDGRNLYNVFAIYHGINVLVDSHDGGKGDTPKILLYQIPEVDRINFLEGVGRVHCPFDVCSAQFLPGVWGKNKIDIRKYGKKVLDNSLSYFVYFAVSVGKMFSRFPEPRGIYWDVNQAVGKVEGLKRDIFRRFDRDIPFIEIGKRMIRERGDKHPMDSVTLVRGENVFVQRKEHPGEAYMKRIVKCLDVRGLLSD